MHYPSNILEEELKNKIEQDFFHKFNCTEIIEKIDFAVRDKAGNYFLWAEAKKNATDIVAMLSQLVLTIGKARTFNEVLPPKFLGCFDCEKITFVPYSEIQGIFYQNDFNWNVTPSNRETKEFRQIYSQINSIINNGDEHKTYRFDFEKDEKSLIDINWDEAKKSGIIDGDFYLADLLSNENKTLKDKLFVLLKTDYYELDRKRNDFGIFTSGSVQFTDK